MKQAMVDSNSSTSHSFLLDDDSSLPFQAAELLANMDDKVSVVPQLRLVMLGNTCANGRQTRKAACRAPLTVHCLPFLRLMCRHHVLAQPYRTCTAASRCRTCCRRATAPHPLPSWRRSCALPRPRPPSGAAALAPEQMAAVQVVVMQTRTTVASGGERPLGEGAERASCQRLQSCGIALPLWRAWPVRFSAGHRLYEHPVHVAGLQRCVQEGCSRTASGTKRCD